MRSIKKIEYPAILPKKATTNKSHKHKMSGIRDGEGGKVVESEDQYKGVWVKYYNELLNDNQQSKGLPQGKNDNIVVQEPTLDDVKDVIKDSKI